MKKRLPVVLFVVLVVVTMLTAGTALAGPGHSTLVMNVTYKVINDEAPGNAGFWALQSYTRQVQVWRMPDGTFYWTSRFEGKWTTLAGAKSPGTGVAQTADGSGTFKCVFNGTFTNEACIPVFGDLGTHDFEGSMADVLSPSDQQAGPPDSWGPGDTYFPGVDWNTWDTAAWTYTYRYKDQTFVLSPSTGTSTGDIVITK
jgi:hypothetical protein